MNARAGSGGPPPARYTARAAASAVVVIGAVWAIVLALPDDVGGGSAAAGFARDVLVHHDRAVKMAGAAIEAGGDERAVGLARDVAERRRAQMDRLSGWLAEHGLRAATDAPPMAWMSHGTDAPLPGLASPAELEQLSKPGRAAAFLPLMIRHDKGAMLLARAVIPQTDDAVVVAIANEIIEQGRTRVQTMEDLLVARGSSPVTRAVTMPEGTGEVEDGHHATDEAVADVARTLPVATGILALGWLMGAAARRRTTAADTQPRFRLAAAALALAGALHLGLTPQHLSEGVASGAFFLAVAVSQLLLAGWLLASPRPAVLAVAGAGCVAVVVVYASFRLVPPPGASSPESFDVVGLATQALQLVVVAAAAALFYRSGSTELDDELAPSVGALP